MRSPTPKPLIAFARLPVAVPGTTTVDGATPVIAMSIEGDSPLANAAVAPLSCTVPAPARLGTTVSLPATARVTPAPSVDAPASSQVAPASTVTVLKPDKYWPRPFRIPVVAPLA